MVSPVPRKRWTSRPTEKIAIGEKLLFDGRLSANGTVACASYHDRHLAFTDGRPVAVGILSTLSRRRGTAQSLCDDAENTTDGAE